MYCNSIYLYISISLYFVCVCVYVRNLWKIVYFFKYFLHYMTQNYK